MGSVSVHPDYVLFNRSKGEAKKLRVEPMHIVPMPNVVGAHVEERNGAAVLAVEVRGNPGVDPSAHSVELDRADAERLREQVQMHAAGEDASPWGARLPEQAAVAIAHARGQHQLEKENRTTDRLLWASLGLPVVFIALVFLIVLVFLLIVF
jgi:hypothetical protein